MDIEVELCAYTQTNRNCQLIMPFLVLHNSIAFLPCVHYIIFTVQVFNPEAEDTEFCYSAPFLFIMYYPMHLVLKPYEVYFADLIT